MLDNDGHLACASAANIFVWENGRLLTPSADCGILPGIVRAAILELAPNLGIETLEDRIAASRLSRIAGAFVTNSLIGVVPLTRIGDRALPVHPLTAPPRGGLRVVAGYRRQERLTCC